MMNILDASQQVCATPDVIPQPVPTVSSAAQTPSTAGSVHAATSTNAFSNATTTVAYGVRKRMCTVAHSPVVTLFQALPREIVVMMVQSQMEKSHRGRVNAQKYSTGAKCFSEQWYLIGSADDHEGKQNEKLDCHVSTGASIGGVASSTLDNSLESFGTFTIASWRGTKVAVKKLGDELFADKDKVWITLDDTTSKCVLAKGYILGKDALEKAKAFDESHKVSASVLPKLLNLVKHMGFDKLCAGIEVVRSVDKIYHISNTTKSIVSATGRWAVAAATTVVNSNYFSKGSLWMFNALSRAAKAEECS
ncbi:RNA recognition motif containing protein [Artemisia annua]|uniref:RNA recognition motif containing protein n=1 Tax=Artemisia annua TaxID=35608 RepID=A0A2U1Q4I4_ARTAN|nr:RNA recognition motif containing protein [Artemisia annua]